MKTLRLKEAARKMLKGAPRSVARSLWHGYERFNPARLRRQWRHARLNRGAAADEIVLREGLRLRIDPRSREAFEWFCFRSLEMARELDAFLEDTRGCRRLVDVGSLYGVFALSFAHGRPGVRVLAVDPSAAAQDVLQANLRLSGATGITPLALALGDQAGALRMRPIWHHLEAVPETAHTAGDVIVPVRTLDALCSDQGFVPDAIKIDVEGFESAVLKGAEGVLRRARPLLFLEVHPVRLRELGSSVGKALGFLERRGYRFASSEGEPLSVADLADVEAVFRIRCRPS